MPLLVEVVDEVAEVVRRPEAGRRRVVAGHLVAPRAAEGVLHHRQQLDVGEAEVERVVRQLVGQLPVRETEPPRAQVDLVDAQRLVGVGRQAGARRHPRVVAPLVVAPGHDAGRRRRELALPGHRVGLQPDLTVHALDRELVAGSLPGVDHEAGPDTGPALRAEHVGTDLPVVPVPDHGHAAGVRRPHCEGRARLVVRDHVGSEHLPQPPVVALADQVEIDVAEQRSDGGGRHGGDATGHPAPDRRGIGGARARAILGRRAPQAAGYVGPPCEWPCCRGSTHRWSSAASRPTRTAWPGRWPGPGTRSSSSRCTTPTPPRTRSSTGCGWSGPGPSCPGCPTTTSSPTWPGPTTTWSRPPPAWTAGGPRSCTPTTGSWPGPATPCT